MSCGECGTRKHFFLTRTQDFFFVPCLRQDGKEKNLLFLYQAKKLQSFLSKFCNICMENLVSDQLTISLWMVFFIPITCLLDILRKNSVLVTHKSERATVGDLKSYPGHICILLWGFISLISMYFLMNGAARFNCLRWP